MKEGGISFSTAIDQFSAPGIAFECKFIYIFYSKRTLVDTLVTNKRKPLTQPAFKTSLQFILTREFFFVKYKPYLLYKASIGHVPIYQSHPRAMFHTMGRTCICEAFWTLWKSLSPKHQLVINRTEQDRELAALTSHRQRNLKAQPIFLQLGRPSTLSCHENALK